jgi:hypothetical protein
MPTPQGKSVHTTSIFEEANLTHDLTIGMSCTDIIHLVNQTLVKWFFKHQKTVAMATYNSWFIAACNAMEQIMDQ